MTFPHHKRGLYYTNAAGRLHKCPQRIFSICQGQYDGAHSYNGLVWVTDREELRMLQSLDNECPRQTNRVFKVASLEGLRKCFPTLSEEHTLDSFHRSMSGWNFQMVKNVPQKTCIYWFHIDPRFQINSSATLINQLTEDVSNYRKQKKLNKKPAVQAADPEMDMMPPMAGVSSGDDSNSYQDSRVAAEKVISTASAVGVAAASGGNPAVQVMLMEILANQREILARQQQQPASRQASPAPVAVRKEPSSDLLQFANMFNEYGAAGSPGADAPRGIARQRSGQSGVGFDLDLNFLNDDLLMVNGNEARALEESLLHRSAPSTLETSDRAGCSDPSDALTDDCNRFLKYQQLEEVERRFSPTPVPEDEDEGREEEEDAEPDNISQSEAASENPQEMMAEAAAEPSISSMGARVDGDLDDLVKQVGVEDILFRLKDRVGVAEIVRLLFDMNRAAVVDVVNKLTDDNDLAPRLKRRLAQMSSA